MEIIYIAFGMYVLFFLGWAVLTYWGITKAGRICRNLLAFQYESNMDHFLTTEWRDQNDLRPSDIFRFYTENAILNGNLFRDIIPDDEFGEEYRRNWANYSKRKLKKEV